VFPYQQLDIDALCTYNCKCLLRMVFGDLRKPTEITYVRKPTEITYVRKPTEITYVRKPTEITYVRKPTESPVAALSLLYY